MHNTSEKTQNIIDYNIHDLVGIRLVDPSPGDAETVARQLGSIMQGRVQGEPDLTIRFVQEMPTPNLKLVGLDNAGYTEEDFFILKSSKRPAKVRMDFAVIGNGAPCEIVCESGLRSVPLLLHIINLLMLKRDHVAMHASAFDFEGTGVLVTGWAKGGKSEALLSFAQHGARYIGDEWIYLGPDGETMHGIPENMRLWDWHLAQMPNRKTLVSREKQVLFKAIQRLDGVRRGLKRGPFRGTAPAKYLREAMPALKRQLNITAPPRKVFGERFGPLKGKPEKIFLMMTHASPEIRIEPIDPMEVAARMAASQAFEQIPLLEKYHAWKFAFPERTNALIEKSAERQAALLQKALAGKDAYAAHHPYPCSFAELFQKMAPYCRKR